MLCQKLKFLVAAIDHNQLHYRLEAMSSELLSLPVTSAPLISHAELTDELSSETVNIPLSPPQYFLLR